MVKRSCTLPKLKKDGITSPDKHLFCGRRLRVACVYLKKKLYSKISVRGISLCASVCQNPCTNTSDACCWWCELERAHNVHRAKIIQRGSRAASKATQTTGIIACSTLQRCDARRREGVYWISRRIQQPSPLINWIGVQATCEFKAANRRSRAKISNSNSNNQLALNKTAIKRDAAPCNKRVCVRNFLCKTAPPLAIAATEMHAQWDCVREIA